MHLNYCCCSQATTRQGDYWGSDHQLFIAKFRLKLKKLEKTTRIFRYYLNQIPYDFIVVVTNKFKGFNLIECLKNYVQRFEILYRRWWSKPSPKEKKMQKGKWLFVEALQIAEKREVKSKGEIKKIYPYECRVPKKRKKRWENLLKWTMQRNRGKQLEWKRLETASKNLEISREHFMQRWAQKRTETV